MDDAKGLAVDAENTIFCLFTIDWFEGKIGFKSSSKIKNSLVTELLLLYNSSNWFSGSMVTVILFAPLSLIGLIGIVKCRESA